MAARSDELPLTLAGLSGWAGNPRGFPAHPAASRTHPRSDPHQETPVPTTSAGPTGAVIDTLLNDFGRPLGPDMRRRLRSAMLDPSPATWDDAHTVLVTPTRTLWQVMLDHDPGCPRSAPSGDTTPEVRWNGYRPDPFTVLTALRAEAETLHAESDRLEIDYPGHVALWRRGSTTVEVWSSDAFTARLLDPHRGPTYTLAVPPDRPYTHDTLDLLARALIDPLEIDDDGRPDPEHLRRRAALLVPNVVTTPGEDYGATTGAATPALALAGATVRLALDEDTGRLVVDVGTAGVPAWLVDERGRAELTVRVDGRAIVR